MFLEAPQSTKIVGGLRRLGAAAAARRDARGVRVDPEGTKVLPRIQDGLRGGVDLKRLDGPPWLVGDAMGILHVHGPRGSAPSSDIHE